MRDPRGLARPRYARPGPLGSHTRVATPLDFSLAPPRSLTHARPVAVDTQDVPVPVFPEIAWNFSNVESSHHRNTDHGKVSSFRSCRLVEETSQCKFRLVERRRRDPSTRKHFSWAHQQLLRPHAPEASLAFRPRFLINYTLRAPIPQHQVVSVPNVPNWERDLTVSNFTWGH